MKAFQFHNGEWRLVLVIAAREIKTATQTAELRSRWEAAFAEQGMEIHWW